jgi:hypothetical protein
MSEFGRSIVYLVCVLALLFCAARAINNAVSKFGVVNSTVQCVGCGEHSEPHRM